MRRHSTLRSAAAVAAVLLSAPASAAFVDLNGSTLDTTTGLEWLDLDKSRSYTFREVVELPLFDTWRHATSGEVQSLLRAWNIPVTPLRVYPLDPNGQMTPEAQEIAAALRSWQTLFNERGRPFLSFNALVADTMGGHPQLHHVYRATTGAEPLVHTAPLAGGVLYTDDVAFKDDDFGTIVGLGENRRFSILVFDHFLVRQAAVTPIPEPETYALMLAGLAGLAATHRRRCRRGPLSSPSADAG